MKRNLTALLLGTALVLSACTGGSGAGQGAGSDGASPAAFPTTSAPPRRTGSSVEEVVREVLPAVVNVVTNRGEGTGFVVRSDGIVVTNFHVVEGATTVEILTSDEEPQRYDARVIGGDIEADLAVLQADAADLPTVPLGDSDALQLGQDVVAIGYALGLQGGPSVTAGIVSSLTRQITVPDRSCTECQNAERVYSDVVQTDAAINPGNSGGPLVDLAGNVVGINTAGTSAAENVGFAIQVNAAKPTIMQAAENPSEPVAFLGVSSAPASSPQIQFQLEPAVDEGAAIISVVPNGPADDAGIEVGDVIVSFAGQDVGTPEALGEEIRSQSPGDRVEVGIVRGDGASETVTVTLGTNPVATR